MKKIISILILIQLSFLLFTPVQAANLKDAFGDNTLKKAASGAGYSTDDSGSGDINQTIGNIIKYILSFLGVIFMALIIYAGFLWMTARGDSGQVDKAKDIMRESVIGLAIVILAYAISSFVIGKLWSGGSGSSGSGMDSYYGTGGNTQVNTSGGMLAD